jgi:glycosyltransferase involved in cell wall biosynthesis
VLRLGFACAWGPEPRKTWSYTPWDLREALRRRRDVEVVDVGFAVPKALRRLLQLAALRRRHGRWVAAWEHVRIWERAVEFELNRRSAALGCDVVLQIQDLGAISTPSLIYQDFSYDVIADCLREESLGLREYFPHLDERTIARRRARQMRVYSAAARLLPMSRFLGQSLIDRSGISPDKVITVWPGLSASEHGDTGMVPTSAGEPECVPASRHRLLFVGTTFLVKGGDLVLAALHILRSRRPEIELTIIGPASWPVAGPVPDGVNFLGRIPPQELPKVYREHDLLVVPSRLEGFGKVFVEALAHGMPCIGRRAFAMPELIQPGVNGDLVESDDPQELAARVEAVLGDPALYARCRQASAETRDRFSWDRAARDIVAIASDVLVERRRSVSGQPVA